MIKTFFSRGFVFRVLFILFIVLSCFYINPRARAPVSPAPSRQEQLSSRTVKEGNTERTDFVDSNGNITMAEGHGYATVIITKSDNEIVEAYFDNQGEPVTRQAGYSAVKREYDATGSNVRTVYLGPDGQPVSIRNGYASEVHEFNSKGQMTAVRYYDEYGQPARYTSFGYGKTITYDENGNPASITYIDASDRAMMTREGYATIRRKYYTADGPERGRVESEMYFDTLDQPARLVLGQCGVHKEYDEHGRETLLTYLDAKGDPTIISKGYATVRKTFSDYNQVVSEMYFDQDGNPCALAEGQYGFRWDNGRKIYLDKNGNDQLSLKNLLYYHSGIVIVIAAAVLIVSAAAGKKVNRILLFICILVIAYMTMISRTNQTIQSGNRITWSLWWRIVFDRESRANALRNIWLFIPLGAVLHGLNPRRKVLLAPVVLSVLIETIQYLTGTGYCDLSDIFSNSFGGLIGFAAAEMTANLISRFRKQKASISTDTGQDE